MNMSMTMEMTLGSDGSASALYLRDQDGNIIVDQNGNPIERVEQ